MPSARTLKREVPSAVIFVGWLLCGYTRYRPRGLNEGLSVSWGGGGGVQLRVDGGWWGIYYFTTITSIGNTYTLYPLVPVNVRFFSSDFGLSCYAVSRYKALLCLIINNYRANEKVGGLVCNLLFFGFRKAKATCDKHVHICVLAIVWLQRQDYIAG